MVGGPESKFRLCPSASRQKRECDSEVAVDQVQQKQSTPSWSSQKYPQVCPLQVGAGRLGPSSADIHPQDVARCESEVK